MSILDEEKIDFIGTDVSTKEVILSITDHLPWLSDEEQKHMLMLQAKLNIYLAFVESGEINQHTEDAKNLPVVFEVIGKHSLSENAIAFYKRVSSVIENAGFSLRFTHSP